MHLVERQLAHELNDLLQMRRLVHQRFLRLCHHVICCYVSAAPLGSYVEDNCLSELFESLDEYLFGFRPVTRSSALVKESLALYALLDVPDAATKPQPSDLLSPHD